MRKLIIAIVVLSLAGCATSTSIIPPQLTETAKSVCHLYENAKPKVVALREWAKANWNATVPGTDVPVISSEVKAILTEFEEYLPKIDAAGQLICGFADTPSVAAANEGSSIREKLRGVPWDRVLAATVKVVDLAVQYQQSRE